MAGLVFCQFVLFCRCVSCCHLLHAWSAGTMLLSVKRFLTANEIVWSRVCVKMNKRAAGELDEYGFSRVGLSNRCLD
jgi:hypothetical protein